MSRRVAILIPCFNGAKWIANAVRSALGQVFVGPDGLPERFDVIVRDDGSTDGTQVVLHAISDLLRDSRLSIHYEKNAGGIAASFQAVLELTDAEFIVVLGQDDTIDDDYLQRVMARFEARPEAVMVGCHPRFIDDAGEPYGNNPQDGRLAIPKPVQRTREEWVELFRVANNYFGINTYRRQAVVDAGGFDKEAGWLLDWDLYTRLVKGGGDIDVIEEELCSLTLSDFTTSCITRDKLPRQRQYLLHITEKNYPPPKLKIAFATPFYMSQEFSHYGESMIHTTAMLTRAGIDWQLIRVNGDSYVDRAKNTIMAEFLDSDCTDLVMIDSDEQWHPTAISRLLEHPEEVVAGAYPFKNNWGQFAGTPAVEMRDGQVQYSNFRPLSDGSCLLEAHMISGGFMRIKRSAIVKFAKAYPESIYTDQFAWPPKPQRIYTAFFQCDIHEYQRYGEDAYFCRKLREAGIKLWIDPNITIIHYGIQGYPGNYHEHLMGEKAKQDAAAVSQPEPETAPATQPEASQPETPATTGTNVVTIEAPEVPEAALDAVIAEELQDIAAALDEEAA
jgi:glycosyltransferase involved in cell wall biosynthesis